MKKKSKVGKGISWTTGDKKGSGEDSGWTKPQAGMKRIAWPDFESIMHPIRNIAAKNSTRESRGNEISTHLRSVLMSDSYRDPNAKTITDKMLDDAIAEARKLLGEPYYIKNDVSVVKDPRI